MADMMTKVAGVKTRNGKPLWKSENDYEPYSEKTATFEYGDGYLVTPTIDPETGGPYKIDDLLEKYEKEGPYDLYTGEKLPVFEDMDTANSYAKWRSDNILNFDITNEEFFTGESGTYSKQDGSEITLADRKQDMIDYAAGARDSVYGFLGLTTDEDQGSGMALGGLAVARKGIMTPEGEDMANNKFQLDENKADLDNDGSLSSYEKTRAEAVQKATSEEDELDMYHGGMMGPVDPVSGNPIPIGSSAEEVRDDIDINISQGEYVLPADVVKWHGLEKIMMLQEEAKMGLMAMDATGLITEAGEETAEEGVVCPECGGEGCDHCDGTGYHMDEETTPEGNEVETASVEVSEEEPEVNETDDYKDSDYSKKTSMYGIVKKPKVTFIV
jgi:hypothetical protein